MDEEDYKNIYLNSVKACFANDEIKNKLKNISNKNKSIVLTSNTFIF
ncbi:hypothetical protein H477_5250 [[Clostridium] sordellii ATCC 9714]|nr:hypothetical protein H477_5250 [[Clostridium] sordellii ATCC 9714] [Paeniclostridium sordellii ATCC 9714]